MNIYFWFGVLTLLSTAIGVALFSTILRRAEFLLSDRIGAGFAGAFLGTFAGLLLAMTYHSEEGSMSWFFMLLIFGISFSIWLQKTLSDTELRKLVSGDGDDQMK
jgi:uncharacterized membrane protein